MTDDKSLVRRYLRLIDISTELSSTLDIDELLYTIVHAAADVTKARAASIILYDESNGDLYFQASTDLEKPKMENVSVPIDGSIAGMIFTSRKPLLINKVADFPKHFSGIAAYETESLLGVPLITNEKCLGVLEALNKLEGEFTLDDQDLLGALASQAAVALENARLFQQSDLVAEMVHELRTPLGSIISAAHLITHAKVEKSKIMELADTIQREANRLSDMATSFLDLARLESGRTAIKQEIIDIAALLEDAVALMASRIKEKRIALEWRKPNAPIEVEVDPDKIKQVILNLLSNAIKYNRPDGSITVGVEEDAAGVSFYVEDTGIGMKPEYLDSLFERFYRAPGSEKVAQGTGLGLSIARKIVEGHGGKITVRSEAGKGTRFTVELPK
jgi:signal transduction histidine kinase